MALKTYTITTLNLSTTPSGVQTVTIEYKLWSATTWTLLSSSISVATDGSVSTSPPIQITGLTEGETYNVRVTQNCGSPPETYTQDIIAT